ncbi:unnamed protein product [Brachionus calyciflorus]|uniref:Uncharacterized protein n=1 Tax=Brachionus calyciflorus TaxID=104777 RepID=A0A813RB19_9BILA|nr:unnamed protein product [Brachionus calyciflorus]
MDKVIISLPCGFDTTYGNLKKCLKIHRCIVCDEEDVNIDNLLSRPINLYKLKEKELESEIENFRNLNDKLVSMKHDPNFHVEKSFERILNQLELRRAEVKKCFEAQINKYYDTLRKNVEDKKQSILNEILKNNQFVKVKRESFVEDAVDLEEKIKIIETKLNEIDNENKMLKKQLANFIYGDSLNLFYSNEKFDMEKIFGKIQDMNSFGYEEKELLNGHSDSVLCLEWVDDDRFLSASMDQTIKLWNIKNGQCLMEFKENSNKSFISALCLLRNHHFASVSENKNIKIWDISSGMLIKKILAHKQPINDLKFLSNGHLVSCSADKTIKLWNYESGECIRTLSGHNNEVSTIEIGPNNTILSGSEDFSIRMWDINTSKSINTLMGHNNSVICLKFINSSLFASGSEDKTIKIWNLETSECLRTLKGHTSIVIILDILKSGHLISCDLARTIKFWDISSGECLKTINTVNYDINCFLLTENSKIIFATSDKSLKVYCN